MQSLQQHLNKIAAIFYRSGGETAVICPGSRNAPIIVAFARHKKIQCIPVSDERSAGFIALGIASQTQKPVAIICTSGTAVLNFYPAICEAFYQNIPLIAITADRPPQLIDQWDGQAIRQKAVYRNHIFKEITFPYPLQEDSMQKMTAEVTETMHSSVQQKLPVHINVPLNEPFYPSVDELYLYDEEQFVIGDPVLLDLHKSEKDVFGIDDVLQQIAASANPDHTLKLLLVIGFNTYEKEVMELVHEAQQRLRFPLIADVISHYSFEDIVPSYDFTLDGRADNRFQPEVLITIGNAVLSKNLRKYLRTFPPRKHYHIQAFGHVGDPFQCLTDTLRVKPELFLQELAQLKIDASNYLLEWKEGEGKINMHQRIGDLPFCEAKAAALILKSIPNKSYLQLSNSMPVRYAMMFAVERSVNIHCNRGTSGIDGCSSTAVGAAFAAKKLTTLITGDIAFFYDVNAFWNTIPIPNLRIIVLNNGGGGIFRLIEGPSKLEELEVFMENSHARTTLHVAQDFNFIYTHAANQEALEIALQTFYEESHRPKLLEVFTDKYVNESCYMKLKE